MENTENAVNEIEALVREYRDIVAQETTLSRRKADLRAAILEHLRQQNTNFAASPAGTATRCDRFRLHPRREPVLGLLSAEDLFPFASFTPKRVKELLVPKYTREKLLPLFEIEKTCTLIVKAPAGPL